MKYPPPSDDGTMPTIGALRLCGQARPGGIEPATRYRSEEAGVAEGEDAAVRCDQPIPGLCSLSG